MLASPVVIGEQGQAVQRPLMPGDVLKTGDLGTPFVVDETAGGVTLTSAQFALSLVPALEVSGNAGAVATTLPTAQGIIDGIRGNASVIVPPTNSPYDSGHEVNPPMQWPPMPALSPMDAFRWIVRNLNGAGNNTITAQASSGVTVSGTATLATNTWREYVVRVLCAAPTVVVGCVMTNALLTISTTDTETLKKVQVGQSVYGTNIGAAAVVTRVNYDTGVIGVSVANTGTSATPLGITFTPTVVFNNLRAGTV